MTYPVFREGRVYKYEPPEVMKYQFFFFNQMEEHHRPEDIRLERGGYSYKYIVESGPVLKACDAIWAKHIDTELDAHGYCSYVFTRPYPADFHRMVVDACDIIRDAELTPCLCHGDLTLGNILGRRFIDPSPPRLSCKENDYGKLAQSTHTGWEAIRKGTKPDNLRTEIDELSWAFLVTHWCRLVPHWAHIDFNLGFDLCAQLKS